MESRGNESVNQELEFNIQPPHKKLQPNDSMYVLLLIALPSALLTIPSGICGKYLYGTNMNPEVLPTVHNLIKQCMI